MSCLSVPVARRRLDRHGQSFDLVSTEIDRTVSLFQDPAYQQRAAGAHDLLAPVKQAGFADDVEHAGFVFEVEEGDAAGGGGALPVGDDAADEDAGLVGPAGQW